jgi:hypothetical protein
MSLSDFKYYLDDRHAWLEREAEYLRRLIFPCPHVCVSLLLDSASLYAAVKFDSLRSTFFGPLCVTLFAPLLVLCFHVYFSTASSNA